MQSLQHRRRPSENSSVVFEVTDEELENFSGGVLGVRSTLTPSTSMSGHSTSALVSTVSTAMSGTSTVILAGSTSER